jgi:hypothetical protein
VTPFRTFFLFEHLELCRAYRIILKKIGQISSIVGDFVDKKPLELSPESTIREWGKMDKTISCTLNVREAWFGHCRV